MATPFGTAVHAAMDRIYGGIDDAGVRPEARKEFDHVRDATRLVEATALEPLAAAFAEAELNPRPGQPGIGVVGPNLFPPLGYILRKRLPQLSDTQIDTIRTGIVEAMAEGYVGVMSSEAPAEANDDLERIWTMTVRLFRGDGLKRLPLPAPVLAHIDSDCETLLERRLREAGALGWRRGRAPLMGRYYGHAGGLMRAVQVGFVLPSMELLASSEPHLWPFAEYVGAN